MRKIIKKLKQDIVNFETGIFKHKVIHTYPIVPIQLISILANYKTKNYEIKFNTYVEPDRLEQIILQIIRNNDLFRSSIISKNGTLFIQEHESPEELRLPVLDFSYLTYEEREKIMEKLFNHKFLKRLGTMYFFVKLLAARHLFLVLRTIYTTNKKYWLIHKLLTIPLFNNHEPARKYALGKFILVKNNSKEYKLILRLDHLVFDDISFGHLIEEIEKSYYSDAYTSHKPLCYSNYAAQLRKGLDNKDPDIIIDKLRLHDHYKASKKINKKPSHSEHYLFRYCALVKDSYHNELIEVATFMSAIICSKIFQIENVPITLVSGNRKYHEQNYYNTVGLIEDLVPIFIELGKYDYHHNKNNINNCLNYLSPNSINILGIYFTKYNDEKWHHIIKLLNLEKLITSEPVIILNIEFDSGKRGIYEDLAVNATNYNQISIVKSKDKSLIYNVKKKGGIIFWVDITKNSINFKIESLFPIKEQYFNTFTQDISEFIVTAVETNNVTAT
jgi:hypothetical protein